jgi:Ca2+-binding EF-hand superfamily protein
VFHRRFSVTTDPNVQKADVVGQHERILAEGAHRRQSRRLRRQLEDVLAGTPVTGCVKGVVKEGVLVTVTSLGPMEVVGLIRKSDLPEQFQVPEDLADSHQAQLLQMDFTPGRMISCTVSQVHPNPSASLMYNMKLDFDEFGEPPIDIEISDKFDAMTQKERDAFVKGRSVVDDGDESDLLDDDAAEGSDGADVYDDYEGDVREVFDELVAAGVSSSIASAAGKAKTLLVEDLYAWDALQDMLADGDLTEADVEETVRRVGARSEGALTFQQFEEVVELLQDKANGSEGDAGEVASDRHEVSKLARTTASQRAPQPGGAAQSDQSAPTRHTQHDEDLTEDENGEEEEEDFDAALQEAFDALKGHDGRVTVARFREWEDIQAMVEVGAVSQEVLDSLIKEVVGQLKQDGKTGKEGSAKAAAATMDLEQFGELLMRVDAVAGMHAGQEDDLAEGGMSGTNQEDEDEPTGDEDREAERRELFDELANAKGKIPVKAFLAWEEIEELLQEQTLTQADLQSMLKEIGCAARGALDYPQFCNLLERVEQVVGEPEVGAGVKKNGSSHSAQVGKAGNDGELQRREIFDELANINGKVPVKAFLAWEEIEELLQEQTLTQADLQSMLTQVGCGPRGELDFQQFGNLLGMIQQLVKDSEGGSQTKSNTTPRGAPARSADDVARNVDDREAQRQSKASQRRVAVEGEGEGAVDEEDYGTGEEEDDAQEEDDEPTAQELEEMSRMIFDELKPAESATLPATAFLAWDGIRSEIQADSLKESEVAKAIKRADKRRTGELTYEQFVQVMDELEEIVARRTADGKDDDAERAQADGSKPTSTGFGGPGSAVGRGDEAEAEIQELTAELYNELKGKVTISASAP